VWRLTPWNILGLHTRNDIGTPCHLRYRLPEDITVLRFEVGGEELKLRLLPYELTSLVLSVQQHTHEIGKRHSADMYNLLQLQALTANHIRWGTKY